MDRDVLQGLADRVKGFLDPEEGLRLYEAALEAGRRGRPCLEIGSYCGKSTLYLGAGCRESGGVLYAVDHHQGSEEQQPGQEYFDPELLDPASGRVDTFSWFRRTLREAGLEDTVVPIVARSEVAARGWATPLGLVFIDGGHSFEAAYTDYVSWAPHLVPAGLLMIHDIFLNPADGGQAPRQVYRLALASGLFEEVYLFKTLGALRRIPCGVVPEAVRRRARDG